MAFSDKLTVVIDFVTGPAQSGLGKMRSEVKKAEGAFGKMQAAGSVAFDAVKANAANFAMAAGAALVTFGVKSVKAFQDTALAAGQFSDATGIGTEAASRWIEVAGDFGIEAGAVQGAMQKMNRAIADGKPTIEQFGDAIVRSKDGTVDSAASFQNLITQIGAIKDPTERAQAAQEVFGRSYGDVARLMEMSAGDLAAALGNVSDAKVIDPAELEKARRFQASMDNLKDKLEDVSLALGESLVPMLSDTADTLGAVSDAADLVTGAQGGGGLGRLLEVANALGSPLGALEAGMSAFGDSTDDAVDSADAFSAAWDYLTGEVVTTSVDIVAGTEAAAEMARIYGERLVPAADSAAESMSDAEESASLLNDTYARLKGTLDEGDALDKAAEATWNFRSETDRTEAEVRDYIRALADTVTALDNLPDEQKTNLLLQLEEGDYAAVEAALARYRLGVDVPVRFKGQGSVGFEKRAMGGPVNAGQPYIVGEKGPEIVVPGQSGTVIPNHRIGGSGGAGVGSPMVVNIYPKSLPTDRELIDLVTNLRRRNGGVI
jgi:hypothetical protein